MKHELATVVAANVEALRGRVEAMFDGLRRETADEPGVTRAPYGGGACAAHRLFASEARAHGFDVDADIAANTFATWRGRDPGAPRLVMGSHLDSVPHGGNFDGAAGVVASLTAMAAVKGAGLRPPWDVLAMGIRAEESMWFRVSYIGSRAALGTLPAEALSARRCDTGATLSEHMRDSGGDPEVVSKGVSSLDPATLRAFVEVHIEQAPSLIAHEAPLGVCTAVPGNVRFPSAAVFGEYNHVGLPLRFRRDSVVAAAEFVGAMEALWREHEAGGRPMALTFGQFGTDPDEHSLTRVPGELRFSLDIRAYDPAHLQALETATTRIADEIGRRRGVRFDLGPRVGVPVGLMDPAVSAALRDAAVRLGVRTVALGSPGSHDAAAFAAAGVPTAMLLVRNANGSHNPDESMEIDDLLCAIRTVALWLAEQCCADQGVAGSALRD